MLPKHFQFVITLSKIQKNETKPIFNQLCNITAKPNKIVHTIALQHMHTVYWSGLTIWIGALRENSAHRNITESLLGSAGVDRCPGLSNWCKFGLTNQQAGKYISATELDINRFWTFPLGDLVWHLSTQVNDSDIAA